MASPDRPHAGWARHFHDDRVFSAGGHVAPDYAEPDPGYGMGMVFVPLSALAFKTISPSDTDRAASIFNLSRTIGSSIGIAIAATVLTRTSQINWMTLGGHINPYNPLVGDYLTAHGLTSSDPTAFHTLAHELSRQSLMLGFVDAFYFIALSFVMLAPLVLLLRNKGGSRPHTS